jgi:hypothetical protein
MISLLDLIQELRGVIGALDGAELPYGLCGGLAMAVHGYPRATIDIDVLVLVDDVSRIQDAVRPLGFVLRAEPMSFRGGDVEIRLISKTLSDGQILSLDLLLVTPAVRAAWDSRQVVEWDFGSISVVSREGLILMKSLRGSGLDQDDIDHLREGDS